MNITPGDSINVTGRVRQDLAQDLCEIIGELENKYANYFTDLGTWWNWYEAIPRIKGPKNFPFRNASNIVVPLIRIMTDSMVNRVYAGIFGHGRRIWMANTENDAEEQTVNDVLRAINWAANNNDFNFRLSSYDQLLEGIGLGSSVQALSWREDIRWIYDPRQLRGGKRKAIKARFGQGALTEHVPREQMLWDTAYSVGEAPVVVREFSKSWSELKQLSLLNSSWDAKTIEEIKGNGGRYGASQEVRLQKSEQDGDSSPQTSERYMHDIREVHIDWPLINSKGFELPKDADGPMPPVVAHVDYTNRRLLRLIVEPYNLAHKPFYDIFYRKRSGRGQSVGTAKRLEHMQSGMTTALNQAIDARTRANAIWGKTSKRDYLDKPFDPAHPVYDPDMKSFEAFNLPTATFDDMRLMTAIQVLAERDVGQSDPALGRETRQGGHPSPATSTLALLEQSDLMSGTTRELIRLRFSQLGESVAILYQQFEENPNNRLQRIFGPEDAQRLLRYINEGDHLSSTGISFDMVGMSESFNPDTEMRRALLVSQMNTNYWAFVLRAMQVISDPRMAQNPLVVKAAVKSIEAQTQAHKRFLEAGDIDDIERFTLELQQGNQSGNAVQQFTELAQAGLGDQNGGGLAGPGGVPSNGAAVQPGAVGAFG